MHHNLFLMENQCFHSYVKRIRWIEDKGLGKGEGLNNGIQNDIAFGTNCIRERSLGSEIFQCGTLKWFRIFNGIPMEKAKGASAKPAPQRIFHRKFRARARARSERYAAPRRAERR